jgi:oxygen-independent coproporphyrinogen-3 oxidase
LRLDTLYLGGGTPSRLGGDGVRRVIDAVREVAAIATDAEVTIEANPDDVTVDTATHWLEAGVNRVSLGVQSFDEAVLRWMHRTHSAAQAEEAVRTLRTAGILNISVDLIFALPTVLGRNWEQDIRLASALDPDHISLYGLTVESHTPLGHWRERGEVTEAGEEMYEAEFLFAHQALTEAGFSHYEVSNYAKPGRESRHNSAYWSDVPYMGLGPSAHGFDGQRRYWNVSAYAGWVRRLLAGEPARQGEEHLTPENRAAERVYLGLRTVQGLHANAAELEAARPWVDAGWATISGSRIVLSPLGWLRLDALAASLTVVGSP